MGGVQWWKSDVRQRRVLIGLLVRFGDSLLGEDDMEETLRYEKQ